MNMVTLLILQNQLPNMVFESAVHLDLRVRPVEDEPMKVLLLPMKPLVLLLDLVFLEFE